ncbi:unnamed protein product, partial [Ectocarpus sp. 12 AP-2014]
MTRTSDSSLCTGKQGSSVCLGMHTTKWSGLLRCSTCSDPYKFPCNTRVKETRVYPSARLFVCFVSTPTFTNCYWERLSPAACPRLITRFCSGARGPARQAANAQRSKL